MKILGVVLYTKSPYTRVYTALCQFSLFLCFLFCYPVIQKRKVDYLLFSHVSLTVNMSFKFSKPLLHTVHYRFNSNLFFYIVITSYFLVVVVVRLKTSSFPTFSVYVILTFRHIGFWCCLNVSLLFISKI